MRSDQRLYLILGTVATILVSWYAGLSVFSPIRQSEAEIRASVLAEAPLGSSLEQVLDTIRKNEWGYVKIDQQSGFLDQRVRPPRAVGSKSIRAEMGDYQGIPWRTSVSLFWGFDERGRLIDVWVWKSQDTL